MWITVYSDASFKDGKAKGAYWIKSDLRRIVDSESLSSTDSNFAELEIACLAISRAVKDHAMIPKITGILLISDSMYTIRALQYGAPPLKNKECDKYRQQVVSLMKQIGARIRVKHVKGHQKADTRPAYLNNAVDRLAKRHKDADF